MSPWRQISPQQLLAHENLPRRRHSSKKEMPLLMLLNTYTSGELLELEQKANTSLPLLLHEAIADLIDKYQAY